MIGVIHQKLPKTQINMANLNLGLKKILIKKKIIITEIHLFNKKEENLNHAINATNLDILLKTVKILKLLENQKLVTSAIKPATLRKIVQMYQLITSNQDLVLNVMKLAILPKIVQIHRPIREIQYAVINVMNQAMLRETVQILETQKMMEGEIQDLATNAMKLVILLGIVQILQANKRMEEGIQELVINVTNRVTLLEIVQIKEVMVKIIITNNRVINGIKVGEIQILKVTAIMNLSRIQTLIKKIAMMDGVIQVNK